MILIYFHLNSSHSSLGSCSFLFRLFSIFCCLLMVSSFSYWSFWFFCSFWYSAIQSFCWHLFHLSRSSFHFFLVVALCSFQSHTFLCFATAFTIISLDSLTVLIDGITEDTARELTGVVYVFGNFIFDRWTWWNSSIFPIGLLVWLLFWVWFFIVQPIWTYSWPFNYSF